MRALSFSRSPLASTSRLRCAAGLVAALVLAACSGGGEETASASSAGTTAGESESSGSAGTSGTSGTTGTTGGTDGATGTASAGTDSSASMTGTSAASSTTATSDSTSGTTATSDSATSTTGDTTGDTTTGGVVDLCAPAPQGDPCESDADCAIAGDCCSCVAYNPSMSSPGNCGGNCKQDRCSEWGLESAACEAGVCVVKGKSCDQDEVLCDAPQPDCPKGSLPQVDGACFTGKCLPVAACDWVPGCDHCEGMICNITEGPDCTHHRCIAPIPECEQLPYCDCLGEIFCNPPHESCAEEQGVLVCSL